MEDTRARWERAFLEAVDFDAWGQVEEALEGYQRLQVAAAAEYVENVLQLPMNRRDGIGKLSVALKKRIQEMHSGKDNGVGLSKMKQLKSFMKDIIVSDAPFPLPGFQPEAIIGNRAVIDDDEGEPSRPASATMAAGVTAAPSNHAAQDGRLRPPPEDAHRGDRLLSIFVDKWGFKDAPSFVQPRVVISIRDGKGEPLEAIQETPQGKATQQQYVHFGNTLHVQTPLKKVPRDAAIFFEFFHWKGDKKKKSCKAYCFLEMEEINPGPVALEVYRKPAVFVRGKKTPSLFSVKPLYLHLNLAIRVVD